jgi:DNA repair exonuclease SbcCD ATPase subunit
MSTEVLFWTQIASIIAFVTALFGLYRLLAEQKDATIQLLRETIAALKDQLAEARRNTPDILAQSLSSRTKLLEAELERLSSDKGASSQQIEQKEAELRTLRGEVEALAKQLATARELLEDLSCPFCGRPLVIRQVYSEPVSHKGHEFEVDHEYIEYECGHAVRDGVEEHPCPTTKPWPKQ